jgi:hypothetical protein
VQSRNADYAKIVRGLRFHNTPISAHAAGGDDGGGGGGDPGGSHARAPKSGALSAAAACEAGCIVMAPGRCGAVMDFSSCLTESSCAAPIAQTAAAVAATSPGALACGTQTC